MRSSAGRHHTLLRDLSRPPPGAFGETRPDVSALESFITPDVQRGIPFPPMLRPSWTLALRAVRPIRRSSPGQPVRPLALASWDPASGSSGRPRPRAMTRRGLGSQRIRRGSLRDASQDPPGDVPARRLSWSELASTATAFPRGRELPEADRVLPILRQGPPVRPGTDQARPGPECPRREPRTPRRSNGPRRRKSGST